MNSNNFGDRLGMFVKILFDVLYHDGYWVQNNELVNNKLLLDT